jgi:hypothetical protein
MAMILEALLTQRAAARTATALRQVGNDPQIEIAQGLVRG